MADAGAGDRRRRRGAAPDWEERDRARPGYSCDSACDANAGREQLRQHSYKLALLDVNMPGEYGMELLSHIRCEHPAVAVVMVTGED